MQSKVKQILVEIENAGAVTRPKMNASIDWIKSQIQTTNQPLFEWAYGQICFMESNFAEAEKYFKMAASKNFAPAQYCLAYLYLEEHFPVPVNEKEGFELMKKGAENGDTQAQHSLADVIKTQTNTPNLTNSIHFISFQEITNAFVSKKKK